ncbi:Uncharacterized protein DBV15_10709 [Temnothorax longispinosus]|uniref:Uncharacterized protein n=1 Tax=Temnothorax longispinosus TaxID=300112 RepID=A0A4S2KCQ2_9HYME|nr:Uncharacterized protein DBV15_10709 [Temnothorax longispinosus]
MIRLQQKRENVLKVQPATGTTSSPRKRQCSPLTRKKTGIVKRAHGIQGTMLRYAHARVRSSLIFEDCRPAIE